MKKITFLAIFGLLSFSTVTLATGGLRINLFDDLKDSFEGGVAQNWYTEAAHNLKDLNIIQGINGNFVPEKAVSRAELAVTLDRFNNYLANPMGIKWEQKKNNYYSVSYPTEAIFTNKKITLQECDSGLMGMGDNRLYVTCINSNGTTIQDIIKGFEGKDRSTSYETFILNGFNAWKVTSIFPSGEATQTVIIEVKDKIYQIGYGQSLNDYGFETFYRSFKPL